MYVEPYSVLLYSRKPSRTRCSEIVGLSEYTLSDAMCLDVMVICHISPIYWYLLNTFSLLAYRHCPWCLHTPALYYTASGSSNVQNAAFSSNTYCWRHTVSVLCECRRHWPSVEATVQCQLEFYFQANTTRHGPIATWNIYNAPIMACVIYAVVESARS